MWPTKILYWVLLHFCPPPPKKVKTFPLERIKIIGGQNLGCIKVSNML